MPTESSRLFPTPDGRSARSRSSGSSRAGGTRRSGGARPARGPQRRGSRLPLVIGSLIAALILAGTGIWALTVRPWDSVVVREECTATANGQSYTLTADQVRYAAMIGAISVKRELPIRAATIATATAMQESTLKNLDYGDDAGPDSRGLFQQRPSQGWGTEEQIMDPPYAINAFYDALVTVPGYQTMEITQAAQAVQRSALPDAYAQREPEARAFAAAFRGQTQASLTCKLRPAQSAGSPQPLADELSRDMGVSAQVGASSVTVTAADTSHGWAVAHWAVALAHEYGVDSVTYAGRTWTREGGWSAAADAQKASSPTVSIVFHSQS